jgi:hypothetical protein
MKVVRWLEFAMGTLMVVVGFSGGNLGCSDANGKHWVGLHAGGLWPTWVQASIVLPGVLMWMHGLSQFPPRRKGKDQNATWTYGWAKYVIARIRLAQLWTVSEIMIPALALALTAQFGTPLRIDPKVADFFWAGSSGISPAVIPGLDIVAVVSADGEDHRETRQEVLPAGPGLPPKVLGEVRLVRTAGMTALAGKGVKPGEHLTIVTQVGFSASSISPDRLQCHKGRRYLLLAFRPKADYLNFPRGTVVQSRLDDVGPPLYLQLDKKNEVAAVMMYPTWETSAPEKPEVADVALEIGKTLDPTDDDTYRRVVTSLQSLGPPLTQRPVEWEPNRQTSYAKPTALTEFFRSQIAKSSPYQQSKIWELLLRWRVPGSNFGYVGSLQSLADDPSVYQEGSGDRIMPDWDRYRDLDRLQPMKSQTWLSLVTTARNDEIAVFFLQYYGPVLNLPEQQMLAQRLLSPEPRIRILVARYFGLLYDDKKHRPWIIGDPAEAESSVRYWMDFFKDKR